MAEITLESLKGNMLSFKRIPILTLDERWYKLMPDEAKPEKIKKLENHLNTLLRKQGQINNDIVELRKIKARLIQDVVEHMQTDDVPDAAQQKRMAQNQRLIQESKEKISALEEESARIPALIEKANQELFVATVRFCYHRINQNQEEIEQLEDWIQEARMRLKKNLLIQQDKQTQNKEMYSYMHDILGPGVITVLDSINDQ